MTPIKEEIGEFVPVYIEVTKTKLHIWESGKEGVTLNSEEAKRLREILNKIEL